MTASPECVWPLAAELGEGPLWSADEKVLWFVDIKQKKIHRFDPASGKGKSYDTPAPPGFLVHKKGGGLVVGMKTGLAHFDPATGAIRSPRAVEPDHVAALVLFLASDDGRMCTGHEYWIDAGWR